MLVSVIIRPHRICIAYTLCLKKRSPLYFCNNFVRCQPIFTARAMLSRYMPWPCVCLSVTSRCSATMAKHRNSQTTPHDSLENLVFWCQKSFRNSNGVTANGGAKWRWGRSKLANFDKYLAVSRKRYKIDAYFLLTMNRKSYALYRMMILPTTLSDPQPPPNHPHFCIFIAFHISVTAEDRDFKFGG